MLYITIYKNGSQGRKWGDFMEKKEQIVYRKLSELHLNENNPRFNDNAVDSVAESIKEFGFKNPLIIDSKGKIWCGNTRYKASQKLGLKEVPCIVADDLTEEQIRKYAILDNKTNEIADWNYELLGEELEELDFSNYEIDFGIPSEDLDFDTDTDNDLSTNEIEKHLLKCPVCGHINEEKAFKNYEDTE